MTDLFSPTPKEPLDLSSMLNESEEELAFVSVQEFAKPLETFDPIDVDPLDDSQFANQLFHYICSTYGPKEAIKRLIKM